MQNTLTSSQVEFDFEAFASLMKNVCSLEEGDLASVLWEFKGQNSSDNIYCNFYLMKSTSQKVREDEFIKKMLDSVVDFTLEYIKRHPPTKNMTAESVAKYYQKRMMRLTRKARGLLIDKITKNTSEFGELFLFMLFEEKGIVQLLNKMNLKTNRNMPVHGLDAVHLGTINNNLVFFYGYSKVCGLLSTATREAVEEISNFLSDTERQDREYDLVQDHIDESKFSDFSDKIVKMLLPYDDDSYNSNKDFVAEAHAMFLGFEWPKLRDTNPPGSSSLDSYLAVEYSKKLNKMEKTIKTHILALPEASRFSFVAWALPFSNLEEFRKKFISELKR